MAWMNHESDQCEYGKKLAADQQRNAAQGASASPAIANSATANSLHESYLAALASMQEE
jgi:hypothetical protein